MTTNPTPTKRISLDLPEDLVDLIEAEAAARMVGRALLIEHLVRDGIDRLVPVSDLLAQRTET